MLLSECGFGDLKAQDPDAEEGKDGVEGTLTGMQEVSQTNWCVG